MQDPIYRGYRDSGMLRQAVSLGLVPGFRIERKFGANPDVDAGTEDMWRQGGVRVLPTAASTASLVSTDAADAAAGTGIRQVRVKGLDANFDEIEEDVTLNGTTPVLTSQEFFRINRMFGIAGGSGEMAAGNITATVDSSVQAAIEAGLGQTQLCLYTVPRGYSWLVEDIRISTGRIANSVDCEISVQTKAVRQRRVARHRGRGRSPDFG